MTANNPYDREYGQSLLAPSKRMIAIAPSDTENLPIVIKALRVMNYGVSTINVKFRTVAGDILIVPFLPGIWREDVQINRVYDTDTDPDVILHGYSD